MLQARTWLPRTEGAIRLGFKRRGGDTAIDLLHQAGAARVRFPRCAPGEPKQAVLLNTAGGLTGGDRLDFSIHLGARTRATLTTAAAEKVYRARDGETTVRAEIEVGEGAQLAWLPQATILFDRARFERRNVLARDFELAPAHSSPLGPNREFGA